MICNVNPRDGRFFFCSTSQPQQFRDVCTNITNAPHALLTTHNSSQQQHTIPNTLHIRYCEIPSNSILNLLPSTMDLIVDFPSRHRCSQEERRVNFDHQVKVKNVKNLSVEHKSDLWLTKEDISCFQYDARQQIKALQSSDMSIVEYATRNAQDTSVFMGLERHFYPKLPEKILARRKAISRAVLCEQQRQRHGGIYDPDIIASISEFESECSRKRARIVALLHSDRRIIKRCVSEGSI
mmetsp:Transcript_36400/g.76419  ORF Transcript_36400/g.76419 Transcript_36400/m.76419 type:complete len:239 (-) Transcript_36400:48-764(-)